MTVPVAARGELLPPLSEFDLVNADRLRERCLRAANLKGTRVLWLPGSEMPSGAVGLFTDDPSPHRRQILIREGLDPVSDALTLAHEVGHLYDPDLNHGDMAYHYRRTADLCESVAHFCALRAAQEWRLLGAVPDGWFDSMLASHGLTVADVLADDRLTHRSDRGALMVVPAESAERLREIRASEGRPLSGASRTRRALSAVKALMSQPERGVCGQWMPRAKQRCVLPAGHSGSCRSVL